MLPFANKALITADFITVIFRKLIFSPAIRFMNIFINRKMLSELSVHEPYSFKAIVDRAIITGSELAYIRDKRRVKIAPIYDALKIRLEQLKKKFE